MIALVAGAIGVTAGLELRSLADLRRQNDERLRAPRSAAFASTHNGFAAKVDGLFNWYTATSVRDKDEREAWKVANAAILKFDRDEIVTEYRESRIPAENVKWLIRYRVRQSRDRWRSGEMYAYRTELRPKPGRVTACGAGISVAVLGGICAMALLGSYPLVDAASVIVALPSGIWAWRTWLSIDLERRRFAADTAETKRRREGAEKEFLRWSSTLASRPSDAKMAAWLDCDRAVLLGKAIDHYKLARHQMTTHAFLEESGPRAKRARVRNGPMRYSRYSLTVFLLTSDGVRQMSAELNFEEGTSVWATGSTIATTPSLPLTSR